LEHVCVCVRTRMRVRVSLRTTTNRLQSGLCTDPQGIKSVSAGAVWGRTSSRLCSTCTPHTRTAAARAVLACERNRRHTHTHTCALTRACLRPCGRGPARPLGVPQTWLMRVHVLPLPLTLPPPAVPVPGGRYGPLQPQAGRLCPLHIRPLHLLLLSPSEWSPCKARHAACRGQSARRP